ncbi:MAG: hypothetical protein JW791_02645 [Nanoarchaeota archaeon]|nr:hypothetical protein [Nanoarchaeota archaeon]
MVNEDVLETKLENLKATILETTEATNDAFNNLNKIISEKKVNTINQVERLLQNSIIMISRVNPLRIEFNELKKDNPNILNNEYTAVLRPYFLTLSRISDNINDILNIILRIELTTDSKKALENVMNKLNELQRACDTPTKNAVLIQNLETSINNFSKGLQNKFNTEGELYSYEKRYKPAKDMSLNEIEKELLEIGDEQKRTGKFERINEMSAKGNQVMLDSLLNLRKRRNELVNEQFKRKSSPGAGVGAAGAAIGGAVAGAAIGAAAASTGFQTAAGAATAGMASAAIKTAAGTASKNLPSAVTPVASAPNTIVITKIQKVLPTVSPTGSGGSKDVDDLKNKLKKIEGKIPRGKLDIKATIIAWALIIGFGFVPSIWAFFGGGPLHAAELWIPIVLLIIAILGTIGAILISFYVQAIPLLGTIIAYVVAAICVIFFLWGYVTSVSLDVEELASTTMSAVQSAQAGDLQPVFDLVFRFTGVDLNDFGDTGRSVAEGLTDVLGEYGLGLNTIGAVTGGDTPSVDIS